MGVLEKPGDKSFFLMARRLSRFASANHGYFRLCDCDMSTLGPTIVSNCRPSLTAVIYPNDVIMREQRLCRPSAV